MDSSGKEGQGIRLFLFIFVTEMRVTKDTYFCFILVIERRVKETLISAHSCHWDASNKRHLFLFIHWEASNKIHLFLLIEMHWDASNKGHLFLLTPVVEMRVTKGAYFCSFTKRLKIDLDVHQSKGLIFYLILWKSSIASMWIIFSNSKADHHGLFFKLCAWEVILKNGS